MMRRHLLASGLLAGATKTLSATPGAAGAAPEFVGIGSWLNTEAATGPPVLLGRATLVNFWTYTASTSC